MPELHRSATVTAAALAAGHEHGRDRHRHRAGLHPQPDGHRPGGAGPRRAVRRPVRARARQRACSGSTRTGTTPAGASRSAHLRETVAHHPRSSSRRCTDGEPIDLDGEYEPMRIRGYQRPFPVARGRDPDLPRRDGPGDDAPGRGRDRRRLDQPRALLPGATCRAQVLPAARRGARPHRGQDAATTSTSWSRRAARSTPTRPRPAAGRPASSASTPACAPTPTSSSSTASARGQQRRSSSAFRSPARCADYLGDLGAPTRMVDALTLAGTPRRGRARGSPRTTAWSTRVKLSPPTHGLAAEETRAAQARDHRADRRPRTGGMAVKPLEDVRIIAVEQYGAGPVGQRAPGRPRRRGHQDRGPVGAAATSAATCRRTPRTRTRCSSRPSTATSAASRSTSSTAEGRAVFEDLVRGRRRRLLQPARRRAGEDRHHLRRPQAPQPGASSAAR